MNFRGKFFYTRCVKKIRLWISIPLSQSWYNEFQRAEIWYAYYAASGAGPIQKGLINYHLASKCLSIHSCKINYTANFYHVENYTKPSYKYYSTARTKFQLDEKQQLAAVSTQQQQPIGNRTTVFFDLPSNWREKSASAAFDV